MTKKLQVEVGDIVVLRAVVLKKSNTTLILRSTDCDTEYPFLETISTKRVHSVEKAPWRPEVGKQCLYRYQSTGKVCLSPSYTIEAIVRDQLFVSFTLDGGTSRYTNFPKDQAVCAD